MINTGGPNIMLACTFRSGSTHIMQSICKATGFRDGALNGLHGEGHEEQNVNPFMAAILCPYGYFVFHHHIKATPANLTYIRAFNNRVVVLTRNLYDSLVSLREWAVSAESGNLIPGVAMPPDLKTWRQEEQMEWLVDNAVPWYLQFTVSWLAVQPRPLWLDYDEYYADQVKGLTHLLDALFLLPRDGADFKAITGDTRYKSGPGVKGRGKAIPQHLKDRVEGQIDRWGPWAAGIREKLL